MPWPAAEVQIDEELVRQLLAEQHPDLAELPLRIADSGFDNELWRLGDDLAVRMPRRAVAADLLANEQRWLPGTGRTAAVSRSRSPLRLGRPSLGYPWPWSVVPWLTGDPGDQVPVTDRCDAGQRLGAFLRALHQPAPPSAPFNSWRSVPLTARAETFEAQLAALGTDVDSRGIRRVWRRAISAEPISGPAQWIHGDLHPANTLTGAEHWSASSTSETCVPVTRQPMWPHSGCCCRAAGWDRSSPLTAPSSRRSVVERWVGRPCSGPCCSNSAFMAVRLTNAWPGPRWSESSPAQHSELGSLLPAARSALTLA